MSKFWGINLCKILHKFCDIFLLRTQTGGTVGVVVIESDGSNVCDCCSSAMFNN